MPEENAFLNYWNKEEGESRRLLTLLRESPDDETVHQFRVAVKKLNACIQLYCHYRKKHPGGVFHLSKTKELFNILEYQRNLLICRELLMKAENVVGHPFSSLDEFLAAQLIKSTERSAEAIRKFRTTEIQVISRIFKSDQDLPEPRFILQRIRHSLQHLSVNDYGPHQIRIRLKATAYWMSMLPAPGNSLVKVREQTARILDRLGFWQDAEVFVRYAEHFRKDLLPRSSHEHTELKKKVKTLKKQKKADVQFSVIKIRKLISVLDNY